MSCTFSGKVLFPTWLDGLPVVRAAVLARRIGDQYLRLPERRETSG